MNRLTARIDALKQAIVNGNDFDNLMAEILQDDGSSAIHQLLLMLDYPDEMTQEKYIIAHAVESFPRKTYLGEFVAASMEMNGVCPTFMEFLLARIMNSNEDLTLFLATTMSASPGNVAAVVAALERDRTNYSRKPDIVKNSTECILHLSSSL